MVIVVEHPCVDGGDYENILKNDTQKKPQLKQSISNAEFNSKIKNQYEISEHNIVDILMVQ